MGVKFKVLAGDFGKCDGGISFLDSLYISHFLDGGWTPKVINIAREQVKTLDVATEDSVVKIGGAAGWGIAGGLLLGPAGLLAGAILGGRGKKTAFVMVLEDGRKFIGECKSKDYTKLLAHLF
ncbi:MAG: hypothetical protein COA43_11190 [Robiginitomaculum sp.]|nr:MAG: hypothetical protein COA43_11190 [Robiginitomaculum sp.]